MTETAVEKAADRYKTLATAREPYVKRARDASVLTIPFLMPPQGFSASSDLQTPYQSLGARCVRTLASKLFLALFPSPFFRLRIDDELLAQLTPQAAEKSRGKKGDVELALARMETAAMSQMDSAVFRPIAFVGLMHLLVSGNFMVYLPKDGTKAKGYRLDQYVVRRDPTGAVLEIIIQEVVAKVNLPEDLKGLVKDGNGTESAAQEATVELYTWIRRDPDNSEMWLISQEIDGNENKAGSGTSKLDELEWIPLRFNALPSEDYGRGYVEEYLGDLDSLEGLSETLVEASAASARVVFGVKPGGATSLKAFVKAKTGDAISGNSEDVTAYQVQKHADLSVAKAQAQEIAQRLSFAFLLNTAIQRPGERVTAEEIRLMASELDDALGGVYTLLSVEFQLPVAQALLRRMAKVAKLSQFPKDIKPVIVTGLEALGRGHEQQNLRRFAADIIQIFGPEVAARYMNIAEFLSRSAASMSIETSGLIKTDEEIAQAEQQAQMAAMVQKLGPEALKQLGGIQQTGMKVAAQSQPPQQAPQ